MEAQCKLLIITDTYVGQPGGSERHLFNFFKSVSPTFQIDAVQLIPTGNPMLKDGVFQGNQNISLHSRPIEGVRSIAMLKLIYELWCLIRKNNIQVVASYHEKSDIINFILKCLPGISIKTVSSKRDMGFKLHGQLKTIMQFITPKLKNITCPSQSIADQMVSEFSTIKRHTHVIKNGVNLDRYLVSTEEQKKELKQALGINEKTKVMISIGWLKPIKGHKYLLDAFSQFTSMCTEDWTLILLGEGELELALKQQAESLGIAGKVIFVGVQKNVSEWLGASDLAVSATLSEGLSNALIEAAAVGLPIVATNVGGNPEVVEHGETGLLVAAKDSQALASAILAITSNSALNTLMGTQARKKAEVDFSIINMSMQLELFYLSLLSKECQQVNFLENLKPKRWIKYLLALLFHYSGYNTLYMRYKKAHYILMMHRLEDKADHLNINLPERYLSKVATWSSLYGTMVTLDNMLQANEPDVRFALTFDDGYKSIKKLTNIQPAIPVMVYLSTAFIGSQKEFWAVDLENILLKTKERSLNLSEYKLGRYNISSYLGKHKCIKSLNKKLKSKHPKIIGFIMLNIRMQLNAVTASQNTFLTWDDVKELDSLGVEMGGHTHNHTITSRINERELQCEINTSNHLIEQVTNKPVAHFAYPNGGKRDIASFAEEVLKSSGYKSAVTTVEGNNKLGDNPYLLKRFNLSKSRIETPWQTPSKAMYTSMLVNPLGFH
jgi:glycosyltransferase involved in cell wall biosynthesis/peptidoglycan/xylan/chitin deacetylase (PgdA/CDA1 family)